MIASGNVLVLTVGTGDINKLEQTLLIPLTKSIRHGKWDQVVLLPSPETTEYAQQLSDLLPDIPFHIKPLPEAGMENNADQCFGHFDDILARLIDVEGHAPSSIGIDFTRGTKAMSAALVLAATGRGIPRLQYVLGLRDRRGDVVSGSEEVYPFKTTLVTGRLHLRLAKNLHQRGDYAAVIDMLGEGHREWAKEEYREEAEHLRRRARLMAAWDRLDYGLAECRARQLRPGDVPPELVEWVQSLANIPAKNDYPARASRLKRVAWDLLYNGKRRLDERRFEDAFIRAYRVLELVGQFLLFENGMNSSCLNPEDSAVKKLQAKLKKKRSKVLTKKGARGYLVAGRYQVAQLLKVMGVAVADRLIEIGGPGGLNKRNQSILAHGFNVEAPPEDLLRERYQDLEAVLHVCGSGGDWAGLLGSLKPNR